MCTPLTIYLSTIQACLILSYHSKKSDKFEVLDRNVQLKECGRKSILSRHILLINNNYENGVIQSNIGIV